MSTRYASLSRCSDLPERDVIAALISRDECAILLTRIAALPSARTASRALAALVGRLATAACTWLEGDLVVELFEENDGTKVRVMSDLGAGLRERVLPIVILADALAEVVATFEKRHNGASHLRIERISSRCALVLATEHESAPISMTFDISETSLSMRVVRNGNDVALQAPAHEDVDSGWDDASSA